VVPVAMVAGFATSCTATVSAASEVRLPVEAVVAVGGGEGALAAGERCGLSPLSLVTSVRDPSQRQRLLNGASQDLFHEGEGHPGVGAAASLDGAPAGVGGQDLGRTGPVLGGE
jgi:hypothetical protein